VRWRAPAGNRQPVDSAFAPGRASRPSAGGLRVRARRPRCHRLLQQMQRPSARLFESPGGSEATPSGCAGAPPLEASRAVPGPQSTIINNFCNKNDNGENPPPDSLSRPEARRLLTGGLPLGRLKEMTQHFKTTGRPTPLCPAAPAGTPVWPATESGRLPAQPAAPTDLCPAAPAGLLREVNHHVSSDTT
jgi:hypothetical protein